MQNRIIQGCMRIDHLSDDELYQLILVDIRNGINFFDHADIYGKNGQCEKRFGAILSQHPELRDQMIIQTKCGILSDSFGPYYDSSKKHILESVNNSLSNLNTDHLDYLLIHRPDALMDPKEIADAFDELYDSGKVIHFGVSNFNTEQMKYIKPFVHQKIEANQMQFSICHTQLIDHEFYTDTDSNEVPDCEVTLMYYCKGANIAVQGWSPFQFGFFAGVFIDNPAYLELNNELQALADKYKCTKNAIAVAWCLRYSPIMRVISGSTNIERAEGIAKGNSIVLDKEEWYDVYAAAGHKLP